MSLQSLTRWAIDKQRFTQVADYIEFCKAYLEFIEHGLQAVIVSQNEHQYRFYQYREDGHFNISRPINASLMYSAHVRTIDHFFCSDSWHIIEAERRPLPEIEVEEESEM